MKDQLKNTIIELVDEFCCQLNAGLSIKTATSNLNLCLEPYVGFDNALLLSDQVNRIAIKARKNKKQITLKLLLAPES